MLSLSRYILHVPSTPNKAHSSYIMVLWLPRVSLLVKSYILKAFRVAEYDDVKYLTTSREISEVLPTQDITDAVEPSPTQTTTDSNLITIDNPKLAAVYKLETFKMCIRCHSRVEPGVAPLGRCSKTGCAVLQDYILCETSNVAELLDRGGWCQQNLFVRFW